MAIRIVLVVLGAILVLDTCVIACRSNFNLGVILPAFFGIPLILLGILLPHMQSGFMCFLKWFTVGCLCAAAVIFIVCGSLMISACKDADKVEADALIVLGAGLRKDKVSLVLQKRLDTAIEYLCDNPETVCVVSGGQGSGETTTEANAMKLYLIAHGIDESRILTEDASESTLENFRYSKAVIDSACGKDAKLAFVTTGFHVYRSTKVAENAGLSVSGIAAPDVWYLALNNFMRESVGICIYALRGDLG